MLDSTAVRVHQHGAPPREAREGQVVGKSRAGWTSKLHAAVDADGRTWRLAFTGGQHADINSATGPAESVPREATVVADKAYDAGRLVAFVSARGGVAVVPPRRPRCVGRPQNKVVYRRRNVGERLFLRLKQWRRVATRDQRTVASFAAIVSCAEIVTAAH